jgi:hypothetical protein
LDGSYKNTVYLEVAVWPKAGHDLSPMVFYLDERRVHTNRGDRWLVSDWQPAPGAAQVVQGNTRRTPFTPVPPAENILSVRWLLVPLGVFLLILFVPATIAVREWRRNRRATRAYEASLPSLSNYTSSSKPS